MWDTRLQSPNFWNQSHVPGISLPPGDVANFFFHRALSFVLFSKKIVFFRVVVAVMLLDDDSWGFLCVCALAKVALCT